MTEPRIQYAKTKDGVNIAYYTLGDGSPLLYMPVFPWSHGQLEWRLPEPRRWLERVGEGRMLVRYDGRGTGLSDREVTDHSFEAQLLDLQAVLDRLGIGAVTLWASFHTALVAVAYAVRHPENVSSLILWCAYARSSGLLNSPELRAMGRLIDRDWELYTETVAHAFMGWAQGEQAHRYAEFMRECVTQEAARTIYSAIREFDVQEILPLVTTPTLVIQPRRLSWPDMSVARDLASRIPDARLSVAEGLSLADEDVMGQVASAIDDFLGEGEQPAAGTPELPSGTAVILFADIADSTALTERLGDSAFREKARELDTVFRRVIRESGGTPVEGKLLGDGVLAVFTSARQAIECALRCNAASEPVGLQLHLGIHAGDVIREGNNVYGGAVNIAARIAGASAPGEVLVSNTVRGLARTSAGVRFEDRGEHELKGVAEPVRLWAVRGGGA